MNGGACTDHVNRYSCKCISGWSGPRCGISKIVLVPYILPFVNRLALAYYLFPTS